MTEPEPVPARADRSSTSAGRRAAPAHDRRPWLGIVADDVTGACDVAAAVREAGLRTVLLLGLPDDTDPLPPCDCVVIGLGIRTVAPQQAVAQARASGRWLQHHGTGVLYQKYCSTFDSTDRGNIGPVADALADLARAVAPAGHTSGHTSGHAAMAARAGTPRASAARAGAPGRPAGWEAHPDVPRSVGTPATPAAGRTQYLGHLFVGTRLLSESSLRDHPLTPMRDPDLVRVLGAQTTAPVRLVPLGTVRSGAEALAAALRPADSAHLLVDAVTDADLDAVADALLPGDEGSLPFVVGGGAGLAGALARVTAPEHPGAAGPPLPSAGAPRLILSGSASERTREQVAAFRGRCLEVTPDALATGFDQAVDAVCSSLAEAYAVRPTDPVLVAAPAAPQEVRSAQDRLGRDVAARLVERGLAAVAERAVRELGVRHLVVAGGETSGAVTRALGVRALHVGDSVGPGLPWTLSDTDPPLTLLLKSGNFGDVDLFTTAWREAP